MLSVFSYMGSDLLLYGTYGSSTLNIPSIFGYQAFVFFFYFRWYDFYAFSTLFDYHFTFYGLVAISLSLTLFEFWRSYVRTELSGLFIEARLLCRYLFLMIIK